MGDDAYDACVQVAGGVQGAAGHLCEAQGMHHAPAHLLPPLQAVVLGVLRRGRAGQPSRLLLLITNHDLMLLSSQVSNTTCPHSIPPQLYMRALFSCYSNAVCQGSHVDQF